MLRDTSELAKDAISKSPIISKFRLEKILKFLPRHRILTLGATLLLVPSLDHRPADKRGGKRDLIWPIGLGGFEMVLTLLAKTIAIEV